MSKRSFNLVRASSYFWPVKVEVPVDGKIETETFDAEFRVLTQAEVEAAFAEMKTDELVKRVLVGWRGVNDGDEPIAFSPEALERVLELVGMRAFITRAWVESVSGDAARRKN
jgi:hypothetical protein